MADSGKRDKSASVGRDNPRKRHETTPSHAAASTSKTGQPKPKCGKCHKVGHLKKECPRTKARKNESGKCAKCGKLHDTVNCTVIQTWRKWEIGRPINPDLLRAVFIPDDNCKAIGDVDLAKDNPLHLFNRMYDQYSPIYGGFAVRPDKPLPSLPLKNLHELHVKVRDQTLKPRPTLGSFYLDNVERPQVLCHNFIVQAMKLDKERRKKASDTADSYWLRNLDMAIENAANKKGTRYAADIDASLFTPDSNNGW